MEFRGRKSAVTKGEYLHQSIVTMTKKESRGGKVAVCVESRVKAIVPATSK
jgi:hypothetical protein